MPSAPIPYAKEIQGLCWLLLPRRPHELLSTPNADNSATFVLYFSTRASLKTGVRGLTCSSLPVVQNPAHLVSPAPTGLAWEPQTLWALLL